MTKSEIINKVQAVLSRDDESHNKMLDITDILSQADEGVTITVKADYAKVVFGNRYEGTFSYEKIGSGFFKFDIDELGERDRYRQENTSDIARFIAQKSYIA